MYNPEILPAIKCTLITFAGMLLGVLPKASGNVTWEGFIATLQPFSYLVTIIAGFMAIRHWYYATKNINDKNNPKS